MAEKSGSTGAILAALEDIVSQGLLGTANSVAYKVEEIEKHFHNNGKWFGVAAAPNAEVHVADRMDGVILPFTLTAGASDFGAWVQVLGSSDTPVKAGMAKFDLHEVLITTSNDTNPYIIQIATGESAGLAAKIAAEDFTEFPYIAATNSNDSGISEVPDTRSTAGEKVWMRCACVGQTGKTVSLYHGSHEYIG